MIIRSVTRSALCGTVALATGLLVLLPAPSPAAARARTEPVPPAAGPTGGADRALLYEPGTRVRPAPGAPSLPGDVSALSWLVADAVTGDVLAARDAHRRLPPASTLKTLFAVTALPHLSEHARHTVTEDDLAGIGEGSSLVGVIPGQSYKVADLWRGVFLSSGNDAVRVLAAMNGGWDSTVTQMREKARRLGALDTHVVSPDGYDEPGQVSSAYDLAVFGRTGLASAEFVRYSSTAEAQFPGDKGTYGIQNTNRLLSGAGGVERYPGLIGVKNGYTSRAGNTLIAAARRGDRTLLVTVMNPQSGASQAVYEEARSLLDWGFDAAGQVTPVGSLRPAPVNRVASPRAAAKAVRDGARSRPEGRADGDRGPRTERRDQTGAEETGGAEGADGVASGVVGEPMSGAIGGAHGPQARTDGDETGSGGRESGTAAGGSGASYLMPTLVIGAAALAATALFVVRAARRRPGRR
ncbi:D-alanyl-D-alanine carboxypeptidase family protein [Streptomyces liangshanensis]|uniref:D-alanyl-D-alanine carboxypeptidase n=1 Tax=Streptomyces liangshanensis TaxID=2717324 RepID=A0A6G9GTW1_9ACTN|nr:D-alanyl-D-alanine carboxypeptidase [Streptomyces liangshanensis]QIQ01702.1 D-alanyl-D-alanine carboxypeptidase [Streptomyces liangshanensis]